MATPSPLDTLETLMNYFEDCLQSKVIFFTGKGGVGKSAATWATALMCRREGLRVRVLSWDPFGSTGSANPWRNLDPQIEWEGLDTLSAFREYALKTLRFEALYHVAFDNHVLRTFVRAAPGVAETVVAGKILDLFEKDEHDLLLVDLPASGHALSFFQSPLGVRKIFSIGFVHKDADKIVKMFEAPTTRIHLVTLPEELPITETLELKAKLEKLHPFRFGHLLMNQCTPSFSLSEKGASILPDPLRELYTRHQIATAAEAEAIHESEKLELPTLRIPRFVSTDSAGTLDAIAAFLRGKT